MKHLKTLSAGLIAALSIGASAQTELPEVPDWDIYPDTWVATDGVGRTMPTSSDVGDYKYGKQHTVGIFYVTWHTGGYYSAHSPYGADVSKILDKDPNARKEAKNAAWQPQYYGTYHWGEPEMGYFLSADPFVIRRDISMLSDAGVDVLILDVTNAVRYWTEWNELFKVLEDMKAEGNKVPQICFWSFNGDAIYVVQEIYDLFYAKGSYRDLWFYWYGKPLLLYNATPSFDANGSGHKLTNYLYDPRAATDKTNAHYGDPLYTSQYLTDYPDYIKNFFTLRNMWWGYASWGGKAYVGQEDKWSFGYELQSLGGYSAKNLVSKHNGKYEEYAVTPAQHPISLTGKSWTRSGGEPQLDDHDLPVAQYVKAAGKTVSDPESYGIYFQDRWDEALSVNPQFIYLNDWNEYIAGKYDGSYTFMRRSNNGFRFVDQYNAEFNRTIGPVKGRYTDNYYMQMAQNIRRYKGARPIPENYGLAEAAVASNDSAAWSKITTEYRDTRGDITHRAYNGYGGLYYTDVLGRNDIVRSKVAVTSDSIYFRVETEDDLTPYSGKNWMMLFIDADKDHSTGWNGYDYVVNKKVYGNTSTSLQKYSSTDSTWTETAKPRILVRGNVLLVALSRADLGITSTDITFDFKWVDNARDFDSPIGLATAGDAAPNRRFNYRFIWHRDGEATVSAKQKLVDYVEQCLKEKLTDSYEAGNEAGMISDDKVLSNYNTALNAAYTGMGNSLSDDGYTALLTTLENAVKALKTAAVNPVREGYYYIQSASSATAGGNAGLMQTVSGTKLKWDQRDDDSPYYVWKITPIDGGYSIQNRSTGKYIWRQSSASGSMTVSMSSEASTPQTITPLNSAGQFNISNTFYPYPYYERYGEASRGVTNGYIVGQEGGASSPAAWRLKNADGYFQRNLLIPMNALLSKASEKLSSAVQMKDGKEDPLSPAYNSVIAPRLSEVKELASKYSLLDMYSLYPEYIDSLRRALDSLQTVWPDSAHLTASLAQTAAFIAANGKGGDVGQPSDELYSKLLGSYASAVGARPFYALTPAALDSIANDLDTAYAKAYASIKLPAEGEWYNIISGDTTSTGTYKPGGTCLVPFSAYSTSALYWSGTPEENAKTARSAWRFVAMGDTAYAIQNVGSGWYLGSSSGAGSQMKMSAEPVPYKLQFLGARQWGLYNAVRKMNVTSANTRRSVVMQTYDAECYGLTSWRIAKIGGNNFSDSLSAVKGSPGVLTLPYAQKELPHTASGDAIRFYTVCGSTLDASGKTISVDLAEYKGTEVEAGYPLVYIAGTGYDASASIPFFTSPVIGSDITTDSRNVNGLVGVAGTTVLKNDSCGYFSGEVIKPVTSSYTIKPQTGYIFASHIVSVEGAETALTVRIDGNGLSNGIARIFRPSDLVDVYSVDGVRLRSAVEYSKALQGLSRGIYIIGRQKYLVK